MARHNKYDWQTAPYNAAGFTCEMPNNVTLVVSPDATTHFGSKPKRGTTWRAQASQWDGNCTISRFGRDEYGKQHATSAEAKKAAEAIYEAATA